MVQHLLTQQKSILITSALPYANGDIHLGHLVEYIQTDIWVRFLRLLGHTVYYVCADDAHGTAISIAAEKCGQSPIKMVRQIQQAHEADLNLYGVEFDNYYSTHSEENRQLTSEVFMRLIKKKHIYKADVNQLYDQQKGMFLADRFVKGRCPRCKAPDQYGDNCDVCGNTYSAIDLLDPVSVYTGTAPILRQSMHYFFRLEDFRDFLQTYITQATQPQLHKKLLEWFDTQLKPWDISRDAPYFGFEIPGETDKYFYVWVDAPVGYMASFQHFCDTNGVDFAAFWQENSDCELYHFIGKDIIYFHALFWSALLKGSGYRVPNGIFAHGFLTINGMKMSKSKNTFITARDFAKAINPETLRYYLALKLNDGVEDIDLQLDDFARRVNNDLVGKIVNIAARCSGLLERIHCLTLVAPSEAVLKTVLDRQAAILDAYVTRNYGKAIRYVNDAADDVNRYINDQAPWQLIASDDKHEQLVHVCSTGLNGFYVIMALLSPVLPQLAKRAFMFLATTQPNLSHVAPLPAGHTINSFAPLLRRLDPTLLNPFKDDAVKRAAHD